MEMDVDSFNRKAIRHDSTPPSVLIIQSLIVMVENDPKHCLMLLTQNRY